VGKETREEASEKLGQERASEERSEPEEGASGREGGRRGRGAANADLEEGGGEREEWGKGSWTGRYDDANTNRWRHGNHARKSKRYEDVGDSDNSQTSYPVVLVPRSAILHMPWEACVHNGTSQQLHD
jgi:hypothetical protein